MLEGRADPPAVRESVVDAKPGDEPIAPRSTLYPASGRSRLAAILTVSFDPRRPAGRRARVSQDCGRVGGVARGRARARRRHRREGRPRASHRGTQVRIPAVVDRGLRTNSRRFLIAAPNLHASRSYPDRSLTLNQPARDPSRKATHDPLARPLEPAVGHLSASARLGSTTGNSCSGTSNAWARTQ